ncbi:PTS sugar transporter subunit IIA [bacterium]|nr:PTS sugar transporter subunit IIA [bacterium]
MELLFKNYVKKDLIFRLEKDDKFDLITRFAARTCKLADIPGEAVFIEELLNRERQLSTGIGLGIAIPHARIDGIDDFILSIARVKEGIPFESIDNKPVKALFLIAAPRSRQGDYIKLLAQIIFFAKDKNNFKRLVNAEAGDLERYIKEEK